MVRHFGKRKLPAPSSSIKNPYIYGEMLNTLNRFSDEKFNSISIETFKYLARQVSYVTAKSGLQYWDRAKDIEWLNYLVDQISAHMDVVPENSQALAGDIFRKILKIKQYEEDSPKNEETAKDIVRDVNWILKKIDQVK